MADLKYQSQAPAGRRAQEIDEGLRSYMLGVYNYMALGVAATAIITLFVASSPALLQVVVSLKWVFFIGILGMGFLAPRLIFSNSAVVAHGAFWGYCALWGLGIAPMVGHYMGVDPGMVVQAFGIAAATFGATSLFGYVTKRSLSGLGTFFMIATIGIIIAMVVNAVFIGSIGFSLVVSIITVLLFAGITAYETQMIKEMYVEGDGSVTARGKSIFGAFMLYGSFITMFIHILNILGIMNSD
ncbi:MAG: Bax inhibitor-1/YccA family protein [Anderseniella sp.]